MTSKNRTLQTTVADNELNLNEMGFEGQELIDALVDSSLYDTGMIWKYGDEAHKDFIMEKMSITEILDECNELGIDLAEFEIPSDE